MNKYILSFTLIIFSITPMHAENLKYQIKGQILETKTNLPIEYATIAILSLDQALISGGISDEMGNFRLEASQAPIYVKVSFIGYENLIHKIKNPNQRNIDIGQLFLVPSNTSLKEVVVRAEKSQTVFKLDKKIFNVGQDLVSAGGSALDVLNNVPSVEVSIEGQISLRGNSNVQMLINGKPSVMASSKTLGTITADMIERVEVVTNPSAKYDAEGTTGIINIILKKNEKKGLNGSVSINAGSPKTYNLGISLNKRTEKLNLFTQIGSGYRTFLSTNSSERINRNQEPQELLTTLGSNEKVERFYNFILGADYQIDKNNLISLSGHYGYEIEDEYSNTKYELFDQNNTSIADGLRVETTDATNPKWQYDFIYDRTFKRNKDQKLNFSASGSFFGKDQNSNFTNSGNIADLSNNNQKIMDEWSEVEHNFQLDYVHPFSKESVLESGVKLNISNIDDEVLYENKEGQLWIKDEIRSNYFEYRMDVSAAYVTYAYETEKLGLKIGSRIEQTDVNTLLQNTDEKNDQHYSHWFPSFHTSYKFDEQFSIQAGYSSRIRRPHMHDLNPFISYRDQLNLSVGNPDLKPTLTDSYEITAIKMHQNSSLSASVYYLQSKDVVNDIFEVQDNITITRPENMGESERIGIEFSGKFDKWQWLQLSFETNFMAYHSFGSFQEQEFDIRSQYATARSTFKIKLPESVDAEIRLRYRSPYKQVQQTMESEWSSDLALRKKVMKGRGVFNLSVQDVFNTRKRRSTTDLEQLFYSSVHQRNGRIVTLGFSYGFGKGEAMHFSGQKMF